MAKPTVREANQGDADMLARLHVACWAETYPGLLPAAEIARRDVAARRRQWADALGRGIGRVALIDAVGFAQMGPQRDDALRAQGYGEELYALYVRAAAHGTGAAAALLAAVRPTAGWTALVLEGNARACAFYEKIGGRHIETRAEQIGDAPIRERVYAWDPD